MSCMDSGPGCRSAWVGVGIIGAVGSTFALMVDGCPLFLPLVSREWKNGSNSSYNCTPFLHSLLTKGNFLKRGVHVVSCPFGGCRHRNKVS